MLPPSGNRIHVARSEGLPTDLFADTASLAWLDSGTSALGHCLEHIKQSATIEGRPEVVIPGYCCPDLVAAAHAAGFLPVAVDLAPDSTSYDLTQLESALSPDTLAVIAVNFMGISADIAALRGATQNHGKIQIIEDNAQWFPRDSKPYSPKGDYSIFSFGRGKPVSLLGGGVALGKYAGTKVAPAAAGALKDTLTHTKIGLYNTLSAPRAYRWLANNPLLKLGATEYSSLEKIAPMDTFRASLLAHSLMHYRERPLTIQATYLEQFAAINRLKLDDNTLGQQAVFLRYPLLLESERERDRVLNALDAEGLGASRLYATVITEIEGVKDIEARGTLDNAYAFAKRLLTLPTHDKVLPRYAERICAVIKSEITR
ncbi:DegT/DnrJ/EryC1/StrS family aminotransferase [Marinimicrobium alkaliphilum]|uniref:DegT/DnrJ/EryC1/StrS family aminotransferase n=1 Tax=Marinimicrobium alkaliphilum TaxID=2202654 RepID=UPI0018E096F8|nr:DegT/DnrJ/EryC1/StrS family aminotransferase [Marinimicrobium alkaliphilum]